LNQTRVLNGLNQITVVPFGLGPPGGIRLVSAQVDRGMANHTISGEVAENIFIVGFDYWWASFGGHRIHGVKIDVQGMELDVLQGMAETLRDQHPKLVVELHAGVDRTRFAQLLQNFDYRLPGVPVDQGQAELDTNYHDNHSYAFEISSHEL
jgi:FkbM family methyltransferase